MKWLTLFLKCKDKQKSTQVPEIHWSCLRVFFMAVAFLVIIYICSSNTVFFGLMPFISISKVSPITSVPTPCLRGSPPLSSVLVPSTSHTTSDMLCWYRSGWINWVCSCRKMWDRRGCRGAAGPCGSLWRGWRYSHLLPTAASQIPVISMMAPAAWVSHSRTVFLVWDEDEERWGKLGSFI